MTHSPILTRGFCFKVCRERSRKGWFLGNILLVLTQCVAGLAAAAAAAAGEVPWNWHCQGFLMVQRVPGELFPVAVTTGQARGAYGSQAVAGGYLN